MTTRRPEVIAGVADRDLSDMTVLVTGSTSGIGREAALAFGRLGAEVIVHGRDAEAGQAVCDKLATTAATNAWFLEADFAQLQAVRDMATTIHDRVDELDVLVNNAGGLFPSGGVTADGIAYTFGINHLAPFVLTQELRPELAAAAGRVVTTSSEAHQSVTIDFDALTEPETGTGMIAYSRSKLANILFTRELARRWGDDNITATCLHPGAIPGSGFARNLPTPLSTIIQAADRLPTRISSAVFDTPVDGAATILYLGVHTAVADASGGYYADCSPATPSSAARDDTAAGRLWRVSEQLATQTAAPAESA